MFLLAKYGVSATINFPLIVRGEVDLAGAADWTPASPDTRISINGAASAQSTNLPTCGAFPEVHWQLTLTAAELTGAAIIVQIVDAAVKAIEDQFVLIYTYGNALATYGVDLSSTTPSANVVRVAGEFLNLNGGGGQKFGS